RLSSAVLLHRVPESVTVTGLVGAAVLAPSTPVPPETTAAPLLTMSRLPPIWLPIVRNERLVQSDPGPVTSASLLLAPLKSPTVPVSSATSPPASITSRLPGAILPTVKPIPLLQIELAPVTIARLLPPLAFTPSRASLAATTQAPLLTLAWLPRPKLPMSRLLRLVPQRAPASNESQIVAAFKAATEGAVVVRDQRTVADHERGVCSVAA